MSSYTIRDNVDDIRCKKCGTNNLTEVVGKLCCIKCDEWIDKQEDKNE